MERFFIMRSVMDRSRKDIMGACLRSLTLRMGKPLGQLFLRDLLPLS